MLQNFARNDMAEAREKLPSEIDENEFGGTSQSGKKD